MDKPRTGYGAFQKILNVATSARVRFGRKPAGAGPSNPLVIEKQGHFFVGGKYYTTSGGQFMAGQMYVEYQIPKKRTRPYPIVLWHGGGQSGACYTGTPDGREGWAQFFLRDGYPVYVVDQPGRGRSAYNPDAYTAQLWRNTALIEERFTAPERSQVWPQARLHTEWPGNGVAGDSVFDQFYAAQLPLIESASFQQLLNRHAGVALLDRIGPSIILTHSESGEYGWLIADARPNLVKAIVAIEPSGPPVYNPKFAKGGSLSRPWDGALSRPWGVTAQPVAYSPAASDSSELSFVEQQQPDAPGLARCWLQKEPARELVNLKDIPVVILTGEASYHEAYDHCTTRYLKQAGVNAVLVRLADHGIHGNGHVMMLEQNSHQIAAVISDWLEKNAAAGSSSPAPTAAAGGERKRVL